MSSKEQNAKTSEQGGVVETVKEAGKGISNEISKKTGGSQVYARDSEVLSSGVVLTLRRNTHVRSQVGDVVQEKESGGAKKVAKE